MIWTNCEGENINVRICSACASRKKVKIISYSASLGQQISFVLCEHCRKELGEMIKDD